MPQQPPEPRPQRDHTLVSAVIIALAIVIGLISGAFVIGSRISTGISAKATSIPVGTSNRDRAHVVQMPPGFPDVATKCTGIPKRRIWIASAGSPPVINQDDAC